MNLLSYNSKIHATTRFAPFELLTGRNINSFEDFSKLDLDWSIAEGLEKRTKEIKNSVEGKHETAMRNILRSQELQVKNQNNNHRITNEVLPVGTKVYVRTEGIHDKLYPRYKDPFTVTGQTKMGNNLLEDSLKAKMGDTYPLQRLKVVQENDEDLEYYEVEKIIDDRLTDTGKEFLVKWRGFSK